jgi:Bacterial antitoxin of type II TA system, VapB
MITELAVDNDLLEEALQFGDQLTANQVATLALLEYIQRRKQLRLLDLFGTIEYRGGYSYKTQRELKSYFAINDIAI